jgi:hypothetical protein
MEQMVEKTFGTGENKRKVKVRAAVWTPIQNAPVANAALSRRVKQTKAEKRLHARKLDYERSNLGGKVGKGGNPAYHRPGSLK